MHRLLIVGAGGFGRELCGAARDCIGYGTDFEIAGFLDARPDALDGFAGYPPVVGSPDSYEPGPCDAFIAAIGGIAARRRCVSLMEGRGGRFMSLVHRTASVGPNVRIGEGSFVAQFATVSADASVGRHSCVFQCAVVGHDASVGDFAHVYAHCAVGGGARICDGAVLYPGAKIAPRRTVGTGAVVGLGAVAILDVKPGETVFGNPAAPVA